jgi:hemerythrin
MTTVAKGFNTLVLFALTIATLVMIIIGIALGPAHPLPWILAGVLITIPLIHDRIINKRFVEWDNALSTGIESVDNDRKKLLSLINQLQTAAHYTTDNSSVDESLIQLIEHTKQYLSNEENLMKDCSCKDLKSCKRQHAIMLSSIDDLLTEYNSNKKQNINKIVLFIKTWLINHIYESSTGFSLYLNTENQPATS